MSLEASFKDARALFRVKDQNEGVEEFVNFMVLQAGEHGLPKTFASEVARQQGRQLQVRQCS